MRVQTFVSKVSIEALKQMDEHVNDWLAKNHAEPKFINQIFGSERHAHHHELEPIVVVSVWY